MIEFLESLMPFRMLWDFLPLLGVIFVGFLVITVIETFALKSLKRLEAPKNLFFAVSANLVGFLISLILGVVLLYALALFFGATMAGYVGMLVISLIVTIILIVLIPLLIFLTRFFLFRFFAITETKFRVVYSLLSTVCVLLAPIAYIIFIGILASLTK